MKDLMDTLGETGNQIIAPITLTLGILISCRHAQGREKLKRQQLRNVIRSTICKRYAQHLFSSIDLRIKLNKMAIY